MSARQGKIARLPFAIREELNRRILDGQSGRVILRWLNADPAVKKLLPEDAEGLNVTDSNLTSWRQGGYEDWRKQREHIETIQELSHYSIELAKASGGNLTEGAAAILAGKILEVLEAIHNAQSGGEMTPEQITACAGALSSLSESLSSLRTGDQNNRRLSQNDEKLDLLKKRLAQTEEALKLEQKKYQRSTCELFLKWFDDVRVRTILAGADSNDAKTEKLGQQIFGEEWK